jgi:hypothetical protein
MLRQYTSWDKALIFWNSEVANLYLLMCKVCTLRNCVFFNRLIYVLNFVIQINKDILNNISRVVFLTWKLCLLKNVSESTLNLFDCGAYWRRILKSVKGASMNGNRLTHINAQWRVLISKIPAGVMFMRWDNFNSWRVLNAHSRLSNTVLHYDNWTDDTVCQICFYVQDFSSNVEWNNFYSVASPSF